MEASNATAQSNPAQAGAVSNAKPEWPDYSKGPSALDKASQLFFFTEIVRGMLTD
jgi:NADH dehydrogenase (ubiquinone) Fe-S protein 8